jgi:hypothetical protein
LIHDPRRDARGVLPLDAMIEWREQLVAVAISAGVAKP